jgi:phosphatidylglycerophosphate synthase
MLLRAGGMPLVERAARMALAEGIERVVVVVGRGADSVATAARRASPKDPDAVHIVWDDDWHAGNGISLAAAAPAVDGERLFVVLCAEIVFTAGALSELFASDEPTTLRGEFPDPAIDGGAFVFGPEIFEFQRRAQAEGDPTLLGALDRQVAARGSKLVGLAPGATCQRIQSARDLPAANRILRRSLGKQSDGPVSHYLNRPISTRVTMALAPLRVAPGAVTVVAGVLGLVAAWGLAWGHGLLSGLLIQATNVMDGVDGETSRLHFRTSRRGAAVDAAVDRIVDGSLVAGVGLWLWPFHPSFQFKVVILAASAYGWGFIAYLFQSKLAGFEVSGAERPLVMLLGGRDSRLLILAIGTALYHPGAAVAIGWTIYLSSVGRRVFLMRRKPRATPALASPPHGIGERAERDLKEEGQEPEDQDRRHRLFARGAGQGQPSDVAELHDPHVPGNDRDGRPQSDEGEHRENLRPAHHGVWDTDEPQAGQEDQIER